MNFEELQVIWNSQQDAPLFAIDRRAMHALIRSKSLEMERYAEYFERTIIVVTLLTAILLPLDAWREGDGWHQYVVALICLGGGLTILVARKRRRDAEITFDESVVSIAERSLDRIDRHIRSLKLLFWCFHLPIALCAATGLSLYSSTRVPLIWVGVILVTAISYLGTVYDIRKKLIPQQRDVKELLGKLIESSETDHSSANQSN